MTELAFLVRRRDRMNAERELRDLFQPGDLVVRGQVPIARSANTVRSQAESDEIPIPVKCNLPNN